MLVHRRSRRDHLTCSRLLLPGEVRFDSPEPGRLLSAVHVGDGEESPLLTMILKYEEEEDAEQSPWKFDNLLPYSHDYDQWKSSPQHAEVIEAAVTTELAAELPFLSAQNSPNVLSKQPETIGDADDFWSGYDGSDHDPSEHASSEGGDETATEDAYWAQYGGHQTGDTELRDEDVLTAKASSEPQTPSSEGPDMQLGLNSINIFPPRAPASVVSGISSYDTPEGKPQETW